MTKAKVWLVNNKTKRIRVYGHSGYDEVGFDIVCSSISTAMVMTCRLIEKVCPKYNMICDEKKVIIDLEIVEENEITNIVMNNLLETLSNINLQYPKFLKMEFMKG